MKSVLTLFIAAGLLLSAVASAHTSLIRSTPADGEVLSIPPQQIELKFGEPVRLIQFVVRDQNNDVIATDFAMSRDSQDVFRIALDSELPSGEFQTEWVIMSADGHRMSGDFQFKVE